MTARLTVSGTPSSPRWRRGLRRTLATLAAGATAAVSLAAGVTAHAAPQDESGNGSLQFTQSGPFKPGETVNLYGSGFDALPQNNQQLYVMLFSPDSGTQYSKLRLPASQKCGQVIEGTGTLEATYSSCLPDSTGAFTMPITLPDNLQTGSYELRVESSDGALQKYQTFTVKALTAQGGQAQQTQTGDETSGSQGASQSTEGQTQGGTTPSTGASATNQGQNQGGDAGTKRPKASLKVSDAVVEGEKIVVKGSGWLKQDGKSGSVVALKLDDGAVHPKKEPQNPEGGSVPSGKGILAVVQAKDGTGEFEATIPFPSDSTASEYEKDKWKPGNEHSVSALAGSLGKGDKSQTASATFRVVAKGSLVCNEDEITVMHGEGDETATACVQRDVSTGAGQTIRLRGAGWKTTDGQDGSTVVVKLSSRTDPSADDFQFVHTGGDVLKHPSSGAADATMWALVKAEKDGTFDTTVAVPQKENVPSHVEGDGSLKAGSKLAVRFQSGLLKTDVSHSVESKPLVVDGTEYAGDADVENVTCTPKGTASVHVEYPEGQDHNAETGPRFDFGDTLYLVGENWCHTDPEQGGSWIGVKIDEGKFSHREGEGVQANMTVWHEVKVNSEDGSFREPIKLPERGNVPGGSDPEFTEGSHSFRLLSGSMKDGDVHRTIEAGPFTVGTYRPTADAPVLDPEVALTDAAQQGMTAEIRDGSIVAHIPAAHEGDWAFFSAYVSDGSQRNLWTGQWFQADANSTIVVPTDGVDLPQGSWRLVAQSNRNDGEVLGWTTLVTGNEAAPGVGGGNDASNTVAVESADGQSSGPVAVRSAGSRTVVRKAPATVVQREVTTTRSSKSKKSKPEGVPEKPVKSYHDLKDSNRGDIEAKVQDGLLHVTINDGAEPGDWVYLFLYDPGQGIGWVQVDEDRSVDVDVSQLPDGRYRIALVNESSDLIGWVQIAKGKVDEEKGENSAAPDTTSSSGGLSGNDWWLIATAVVILAGGASIAWILRRPA